MHQIHPIITSADTRAHSSLVIDPKTSNQLVNPDPGEPKTLKPIRNQKRTSDLNQATKAAENLTISEGRTIGIAVP